MKENLTDDPTYYKRKKREWYLKNKKKALEDAKTWREANPERFKESQREWRKNNPHRIKVYARNKRIKKIYGLTPEQYDEKLRNQGGGCAICLKPYNSGRRLSVDHDHQTGMVRGLLCTSCNTRLGMIEAVKQMRFRIRPFLRYLKRYSI